MEQIGRNLSPSPSLSTAVEALKGTAHAERWFPGIVAGETVAALAIDERAKHGPAVALRAKRSGNGLTGRKQFGVAIGSFQAFQHRAARLYSELEVARAAVLKTQQLLAVQEGIQMHGGIRMTGWRWRRDIIRPLP